MRLFIIIINLIKIFIKIIVEAAILKTRTKAIVLNKGTIMYKCLMSKNKWQLIKIMRIQLHAIEKGIFRTTATLLTLSNKINTKCQHFDIIGFKILKLTPFVILT